MLTLTVTRFNGQPRAHPPSATFDTAGGTIGRADSNRLVLEDPERTVSRVHAQIVWRDGQYRLIDRGSNPALVNGTALEPGQEIIVKDGDEVQIGGYQLRCAVNSDDEPTVPTVPTDLSNDPFADIFGAPSQAPRAGHDTAGLDDLLRPASRRTEPDVQSGEPRSGLPEDFDLGLDDPAANRSIDDLFDLGPATDLPTDDHGNLRRTPPFGASPIDDPLCAPNTAQASDPLASLSSSARPDAPPPTLPDRGSELSSAFPLPRMRLESREEPRQPPSAPPAAVAESPPRPADERALLDALLRGLDAPGVHLDSLTPAVMQLIGALLREATQGTLDLLTARATTKREMRTDATLIVATGNNPLKFSPDVETALAHLLNRPSRGFMPGTEALSDAYDDLRAHQVGFVAGMRAALDGVFERFEPAKIEARLVQHSLLDALLPQLSRRARCWDLFNDLYSQLSHEAADDFHALFGKAFVAAYEAQIDRLKQGKS
jgi:FHA domain-containing protein